MKLDCISKKLRINHNSGKKKERKEGSNTMPLSLKMLDLKEPLHSPFSVLQVLIGKILVVEALLGEEELVILTLDRIIIKMESRILNLQIISEFPLST